jgi:hypothetical protein
MNFLPPTLAARTNTPQGWGTQIGVESRGQRPGGAMRHFEGRIPVCFAYRAAPAAHDQGNGRKDLPGHRSLIPYDHQDHLRAFSHQER